MALGTFNIVTGKDLTVDGLPYKAGERVGALTAVIDAQRIINGLASGALKLVEPPTFTDVAAAGQAVVEAEPVEAKAVEPPPADVPEGVPAKKAKSKPAEPK